MAVSRCGGGGGGGGGGGKKKKETVEIEGGKGKSEGERKRNRTGKEEEEGRVICPIVIVYFVRRPYYILGAKTNGTTENEKGSLN